MGAIARNIANNITTGGVFTSSALNSSSVTGITVLANASDGITLISSQTASSSASISFTGLNSTYKAYKFVFVNIHPSVDDSYFQFNASTDSGSNYNVTKTTTFFRSVHSESGAETAFSYIVADDLAQSTGYQTFVHGGAIGNASDENASGSFTLFNPSSTTYVKNFVAQTSSTHSGDYALNNFVTGYLNTTSAVNAIRFTMASGNIDDGKIYLYGIK
jgi:hypothetical protein